MERKVLLLLAIVFCSSIKINAQDLKGSFYIDGNINFSKDFSSSVYPGNTGQSAELVQKNFGVNPNFGYGIGDRFLVGLGINYQRSRAESLQIPPSNSTGYSVATTKIDYTTKLLAPSLFIKYLTSIGDRIFFSIKLNLEYGKETYKNNVASYNFSANSNAGGYANPTVTKFFAKSSTNHYGASLSPELLFLLTKNVGLHANFNGFNFRKTDAFAIKKTEEYSFNLNPSNWTFGVFVLLGKGSVDLQNKSTD